MSSQVHVCSRSTDEYGGITERKRAQATSKTLRSRISAVPLVTENMTRDRLFELCGMLHFVDLSQTTDAQTENKLFRAEPIIESFRKACLELPRPKAVSVDEQMIPFSGRCPARQYVPSKPNPDRFLARLQTPKPAFYAVDGHHVSRGQSVKAIAKAVSRWFVPFSQLEPTWTGSRAGTTRQYQMPYDESDTREETVSASRDAVRTLFAAQSRLVQDALKRTQPAAKNNATDIALLHFLSFCCYSARIRLNEIRLGRHGKEGRQEDGLGSSSQEWVFCVGCEVWVDLECTPFETVEEARAAPAFTCRQCEKIDTVKAEMTSLVKQQADDSKLLIANLEARFERDITYKSESELLEGRPAGTLPEPRLTPGGRLAMLVGYTLMMRPRLALLHAALMAK
ncbi:hypothetical protein HPB52_005391 [Rhipicephalus sanguineus]|uniref:PiggyBac transposable element-derived protein domain-containing protein n=1 Tax=Rhipicephalus sanguineus TaxID=34632 RepID=A0A9D4PYN7_RHISA|nr:hypothetical protein HPB52_005391 [Rhipicephalus sanguineus]